jgi:hypothetical protein
MEGIDLGLRCGRRIAATTTLLTNAASSARPNTCDAGAAERNQDLALEGEHVITHRGAGVDPVTRKDRLERRASASARSRSPPASGTAGSSANPHAASLPTTA